MPTCILLILLLCGSAAPRLLVSADLVTLPPPPAPAAAKDDVDAGKEAARHDTSLDLYWQALKIFRDGKAPDWERGRALLQEAADQENTSAQNYLGTCFLSGSYGFKKNAQKAVDWFRLAAGRGNAFAKMNLGQCYLSGVGVKKDHAQAAELFSEAVAANADYSAPEPPVDFFARPGKMATADTDETLSAGVPVNPADQTRAAAHYLLAEIAAENNDLVQAQEHYVAAAAGRAGIYPAALKAAINYAFGKGAPRDLAKANEMLELSKKLSRRMWTAFAHNLVEEKRLDDFAQADVEDEISAATENAQHQLQLEIAGSFADPKSKDYNAREAEKWYGLAAEAGDGGAMLSLAFIYWDGSLGHPDPARAFSWFKQAAEKGNKMLGYANLAICYQNGLGTPRDTDQSAAICKKYGDDDLICYLGTIGQCPTAPQTYEQEVDLNLSWAKQKNDAQAQFFLALRYENGWGVKASDEDAAKWLKKAAKGGHAKAQCELGSLYQRRWYKFYRSPDECFDLFRKAAATGNPKAMEKLADCYATGYGTKVDVNEAIALLEKCVTAAPNFALARNNLAALLQRQLVGGSNPNNFAPLVEKMLENYRAAERLGFTTASENLGHVYYDGKLVKQDFKEAYIHFDTAAARGLIEAHRMLGQMNERGEGVPITYRDAAYHYRLAALGHDVEALRRLCNIYLSGKTGVHDYERALPWMQFLVARTFAPNDCSAFGDLLMKMHNYSGALELSLQIVNSRESVIRVNTNELSASILTINGGGNHLRGAAYQRLSLIYEQGLGVDRNPLKARAYREKALGFDDEAAIYDVALDLIRDGKMAQALPMIEKAAAKGLPLARYNLGDRYCRGDGVTKDVAKGMGLYRQAANAGNLDADLSLANATLQHISGAPDLDEAIRLAEAAENGGNSKAKAAREQLEALREEKPADTSSSSARPM
jgi:TPR repeat protein